jgi:homoserine dehydrogenase
MSAATKIVVLKFGSSVLDDAAGYRRAVDQIQREVEANRRVCAVVSAAPGVTDQLWREAHELALAPDASLIGELLATGEHASCQRLVIALRARELQSVPLTARELGLRTAGAVLDSTPVALDASRLRGRFEGASVLVAPGFLGCGAGGELSLLGRGGSDLTALFISLHLRARCCLVKDVDGLYDSDPNGATRGTARRYVRASWDELDRVGSVVVQPKAVDFARQHGIRFRIAATGGRGTEIGPGPSVRERVAS